MGVPLMNAYVRWSVIALLSFVICPLLAVEAVAADRRLTDLDRYIEQVRTDWQTVGVAVAVVQGEEIIYARGFGRKQFDQAAPVDAATLFQIGSTSKAFTTAALAILVEEGKIRWDDPVINHLPGFKMQDPWLTRQLTIRDAITHDSGIGETRYTSLNVMSLDEVIRQVGFIPSEAPFRNSFRYSNLLYAVAGKVVEVASGSSWHEFVEHRLLKPLKMNRSGTSALEFWDAQYVTPTFLGSVSGNSPGFSQSRDANVAMPHALDEHGALHVLPWINYDSKAAAGAVVSSAADMANWMILHLNEGRFENRQLLKKETMRELHSTQNLHDRVEFPFDTPETAMTYAMGWHRSTYRGRIHLAHGGGIIGFPAHLALLPEPRLGVVVLANGPAKPGFHQAIELEIFDRLLAAPHRDWNKEFLSRALKVKQEMQNAEDKLRQARISTIPASLPIERFSGTYEDHGKRAGCIDVHVVDGGLVLRFIGKGAFSASLEHWQGDRFRLRAAPGVADSLGGFGFPFVEFNVSPAGELSLSAFDTKFVRVSGPGK